MSNFDIDFNPASEIKLIREIQAAIPIGIVLYNYQSDDSHNPLDRQLEIYTYLRLSNIDENIEGIAKLKIFCRLSLSNGALSLRTIEKNFRVE